MSGANPAKKIRSKFTHCYMKARPFTDGKHFLYPCEMMQLTKRVRL
jgi:hypothetical protein